MQVEESRLAVLRKLAADGFRELDQGLGRTFSTARDLRNVIAKIGRRAAKANQQRLR